MKYVWDAYNYKTKEQTTGRAMTRDAARQFALQEKERMGFRDTVVTVVHPLGSKWTARPGLGGKLVWERVD